MTTIFARMRAVYPQLGDSSKKVADYLIKHGASTAQLSLQELAANSGASTATVSRFANQLGFKNYSQFRWELSNVPATDGPLRTREVLDSDTPKEVANKIQTATTESLNETFSLLTNEQLAKAVDILNQANQIAFFGLGSSNIVAQEAFHTFLRTPKKILYNADYHINLMLASRMNSQDVAILISHTGNDTDLLYLAQVLEERNVPIITITSYANSPVTKFSKINFLSISQDNKYRSEALLSFTSQIAITNTLYMLVDQHFPQEADQIVDNINQGLAEKHP